MASKITFPKDFLIGVGTSAHQIEGDNKNNDWWAWEKIPGKTLEQSGKACDSWEQGRRDLQLIKELKVNAYRFSLEWSRIEPEEGKFSLEALQHYENQIKELHLMGVKVVLTLWHYTLPLWLSQKGGLEKASNKSYFVKFVQFVLENLKEAPDFWITENEPLLYVMNAYVQGIYPPGKKSLLAAFRTFRNLLGIHREVYHLIHKKYSQAMVSLAFNLYPVQKVGRTPTYLILNWLLNYFTNSMTLSGVKKELDFLGVNYYFPYLVSWRKLFRSGAASLIEGGEKFEKTDLGWPIYPRGIYKLIKSLEVYRKPIYIVENGLADATDSKRKQFIAEHLRWIAKAREEGADVRGYFYWTLMDNFEWNLGFGPKYGLYRMKENGEVEARASAKWYAELAKTRKLEG